MKFDKKFTLKEIAEIINCNFIGPADFPILGMNEIHVVKEGDIVFVDHPKYYAKALKSAASVIMINKEVECPVGKALLLTDDPFRDFNKLIHHFNPFKVASKLIADSAVIGKNTIIQPNVFIGNDVTIGNNCIIYPNVVIYDGCIIGNNVTIHAGTIIGADAFYYKKRNDGFDKLTSGGSVLIEDGVDIGAACTIDRGVTGNTTIKKGTKIDNQVHVGHDTVIHERCLIAAQTGIAACVIIEEQVTLWGQVGTNSGITIGANAVVFGQSGVTKSIAGGKSYFGSPISESRDKMKEIIRSRENSNKQKN
ncbi:MAG: UDP-3-O-(3-hydroxymyristoyl)glucosamine N-acyltransferase [Bacteroidetes bacterium]|jgi:UDP-3-O-[3-hydroxymyristoyl] glucosamine N-acyltransferase|nr:UDP-3-O-(3-hydroxymyristoyl)glucosamine N-acyltransferase [Bacteroidota bacterium]